MKLLMLALLAFPLRPQIKQNLPAEVIYSRCKTSVVTILTFDSNRAPLEQGSGFVVARNRVVTNYHVVAGSTSASVVFSDGSIATVTAVIAGSAPKDLVIIEVETGDRSPLALGNELQLKEGESIYAIGAPKGLATSLSNGLVSAFRQDEGQFLIQITASIAPGSSGGPLLNTQGQVVGITTSRLKDGTFAFAVGAGDVQHLLKVPLGVKIGLSDLSNDVPTSGAQLAAVQQLFDQKKYDDARASFERLSDTTKTSFDGLLLLCKIDQQRKAYRLSIQSCDAAIQLKTNVSAPYGLNAYSWLSLQNNEQAEEAASKAAAFSDDAYYKNFLGLIHYLEEKYDIAQKELPSDSKDSFLLTLLAGAALHNRDYEAYHRFRGQLNAVKGNNNGWAFYMDGVAAERDLNWAAAVDKYRACDADSDFIDPICQIAVARAEVRMGDYAAAKTDIDKALSAHPNNVDAISEGIFIDLMVGNAGEADRLHGLIQAAKPSNIDFTDCLYYYGRNQPLLATGHCKEAIRQNEKSYSAWSNAGYVALDNGEFQSAVSLFAKALQLYNASKEKHTVTQELDVCWGTIVAEYLSGDKKDAKVLYRAVKKDYPQFVTVGALKQLPLVWSDNPIKLIERVAASLR